MDDRTARQIWCYLSEAGDPAATLVDVMGAGPALEALQAGELDTPGVAGYAARWLCRLDAYEPASDDHPFITPADTTWPTALADLESPPIGLWLRGDPTVLTQPAIAIVGCRAASATGEETARVMAGSLARTHVIVSGGAYGIDAAAHRGALDAGGYTIAVSAGGIDIDYPRAHADLFSAIAASGAIITEQPPGSRPARHRFLARNRLIAAAGSATIVVEAAARSGALATARRAAELSRYVCAVPGSVTSAQSVGTNQLIREYATCVRNAADVRELLGPVGADSPPLIRDMRDTLAPRARRVYDSMSTWRLATERTVAVDAGVSLAEVREDLDGLARRGLARQVAGRWLRVEP